MKNCAKVCFFVISFLFGLFFSIDFAEAWQGTVVQVIDGDTLEVRNCSDKTVRIHLYGVEAPAMRQFYGAKSAKYATSLLEGQQVHVQNVGRDYLGRMRSLVWIGGRNVNEEMVRAGCAWVSNRYGISPTCHRWLEIQGDARSRKLGIWSGLDDLVAQGVVPKLPPSCPIF